MKRKIPLLTPLRGIAALCVAIFHARLIIFPQWKEPLIEYTQFLENSYLWVDLFFLLSGFVMMYVYKNTFMQDVKWVEWKKFMWLRFSRIYPLFIITLLILFIWESIKYSHSIGFYGGPLLDSWGLTGISAFEGPFNTFDSLLSNIFMFHAISCSSLTWNISSWSLSVEWLSYMIFPFIVPILSQKIRTTLWVPILIVVILSSINQTHGSLDVTNGLSSLMRALCGFVLGAWLCRIGIPLRYKRFVSNDVILMISILLTLFLMHTTISDCWNIMMFGLLVYIASNQEKRHSFIFKLFDNRATHFLGDISYSLYLWHVVLLLPGIEILHLIKPDYLTFWFSLTDWYAAFLGVISYIILIILISTLSFHYIEKPTMRVLRRKTIIKCQIN